MFFGQRTKIRSDFLGRLAVIAAGTEDSDEMK